MPKSTEEKIEKSEKVSKVASPETSVNSGACCENHGSDCTCHACMPHHKPHLLCAVFTLLLVVSISTAVGVGVWYFGKQYGHKTLTITGTASSSVKNQIARFTANVSSQNKEKNAAVTNITERSTKVVDAVKKFGVAPEDIKTSNLSVYQIQEPYTEGGVQKSRPGDWYASISLDIKLRDVSKASELATLLSGMEVSDIYGPNLTVDDRKIDDASILGDAVADAQRKAAVLALKSGRKLGSVLSITVADSNNYPYAVYDKAMAVSSGAGSMPIEPGSTEASRSVVVTFELK